MVDFSKLRAPFAPDKISWRVGSTTKDKTKGMALCYIDARDVQDRLDDVCGPDGWQCRYVPMHDKKTVCEIGIRTTSEWIWKADGAGDSDVEAEKGALSDAFKRAAVRFGIGRYLYDVESPWVALEPAGSSYKIAVGEYPKLRALLAKDAGSTPKTDVPKQPTMTPAQWVTEAQAAILACRTKAELTNWLQRNSNKIDALLDKDKALYNALNVKIMNRNDELERAA